MLSIRQTIIVLILLVVVGSVAFYTGKQQGGGEAIAHYRATLKSTDALSSEALLLGTIESLGNGKLVLATYRGNELPTGDYHPASAGIKEVMVSATTTFARLVASRAPARGEVPIIFSQLH